MPCHYRCCGKNAYICNTSHRRTMRRITFCRNNVPQTQVDKSIKRVIPIRRHKSLINTHNNAPLPHPNMCITRALGIDNTVGFFFFSCANSENAMNFLILLYTPLLVCSYMVLCSREWAFWRWDLDYAGLTTKWTGKTIFSWQFFPISRDSSKTVTFNTV